MIQPNTPWPRAGAAQQHDDKLSELVASGDIARVREYFDAVFWEGRQERPDWSHLRIALLREDRPMLKLLHTWGAKPSDADMAAFRIAAGEEKYPAYLKQLRAAGLRPENTAWETVELTPDAPSKADIKKRAYEIYVRNGSKGDRDVDNWLEAEAELIAERKTAMKKAAEGDASLFTDILFDKQAPQMIDKVPVEWRAVVKAFQTAGADEAVIAGGALRDLFNDRPVKDVDIFLRSQGGQKRNRKLIRGVFEALGLTVFEQNVGYDTYSGTLRAAFPDPVSSVNESMAGGVKRTTGKEAWKIVAGPDETEYNFIFIDDKLDRKLAANAGPREQRSLFTGGLLDSFDIGLCRIACDGEQVVATGEYRDDVKYKRISLLLPNDSTDDHLKRVVAKYPDWDLNPAARQALVPKPKPAPARRRFSSYGGY